MMSILLIMATVLKLTHSLLEPHTPVPVYCMSVIIPEFSTNFVENIIITDAYYCYTGIELCTYECMCGMLLAYIHCIHSMPIIILHNV